MTCYHGGRPDGGENSTAEGKELIRVRPELKRSEDEGDLVVETFR